MLLCTALARHRRTKTALGTSKHFIEGQGVQRWWQGGRAHPQLSLRSSRSSTAAAPRAASFSQCTWRDKLRAPMAITSDCPKLRTRCPAESPHPASPLSTQILGC